MPRDYDDEDDRPPRRRDDEDDRPRRRRDDDYDRRPAKKGMSVAVIVLIVFGGLLLLCVIGGALLLLPGMSKVREAAARTKSQNNLKQLALGGMNYANANTNLPTPYVRPPAGTDPPADKSRRLSWRAALLPYIEQDPLYNRLNLSEPWDSPANRPIADSIVPTYFDPHDPPSNQTRYRVFVGGGALFDEDKPVRFPDGVPDGLSNTIYCVEAADTVPWAQYNELPFSRNGSLPRLGRPDAGGANVAFADGAVKFLSDKVDREVLKQAITRNGGEILPEGWENR